MNTDDQKKAQAALLSRKGEAILGCPVEVRWMEEKDDALGYTSADRENGSIAIYVAWDSKNCMSEMTDDEKGYFRSGIFAHELLHQVLTDFNDLEKTARALPDDEETIFLKIFNLIEDPAIEYQAGNVFGGFLLKSLKYAISETYRSSPPIDVCRDEFTQFVAALVNYGDLRRVKGSFTFPMTEKYFRMILPTVDEAITEPDGEKRIQKSLECFEMTRELWERHKDEVNSDEKEKMEKQRTYRAALDPHSKGKKILVRVRKGTYRTGDAEVCPELDFTPDKTDLDELKDMMDVELKKLREKAKEDKAPEHECEKRNSLRRLTLLHNVYITGEDHSTQYQETIARNRSKIKKLTEEMQELFFEDREEKVRSESGEYDILRGSIGVTSRIFDRRKAQGSKRDMGVMILVDQSGSMGYEDRYITAMETSIVLGEAFMNLGIPHYIMGFSADEFANERTYDAVHTHFVTWKSTRQQHENLCAMMPVNNNYDGFSIRKAGSIISQCNAANRLLIVISDGEPSCFSYGTQERGIEDTKEAVREVRKKSQVVGIGIGDIDDETMQQIYGSDYISIPDMECLTNVLIKRIVKIVKERFDR